MGFSPLRKLIGAQEAPDRLSFHMQCARYVGLTHSLAMKFNHFVVPLYSALPPLLACSDRLFFLKVPSA